MATRYQGVFGPRLSRRAQRLGTLNSCATTPCPLQVRSSIWLGIGKKARAHGACLHIGFCKRLVGYPQDELAPWCVSHVPRGRWPLVWRDKMNKRQAIRARSGKPTVAFFDTHFRAYAFMANGERLRSHAHADCRRARRGHGLHQPSTASRVCPAHDHRPMQCFHQSRPACP